VDFNFDEIIDRKTTYSAKWSQVHLGSPDMLPLWVADMDFKCPPAVIEAVEQAARHGVYGYCDRMDDYYETFIMWNKDRNRWKIQKDWIVYSPGIVPALNYAVQSFCAPGDKVIIQPPVYYPFFDVVTNNGCQLVENKLIFESGRYTMDFDSLESQLADPKVKALILCNPHNPVGRVWSKDELTTLGNLCIKHNVLVLSDEIHSDLVYSGYHHVPFASLSEEFAQNSIVCMAPSKTFNLAGLQTSNIIIPNPVLRQMFFNTIERAGTTDTNLFGIVAAVAAYRGGALWLSQLLKYLENNMKFMDQFLHSNLPEVKLIKPEGTYLAWLDCKDAEADYKVLERRIRSKGKVLLDEGYIFGSGGEGFERINIACPLPILEEALKRIEHALHHN